MTGLLIAWGLQIGTWRAGTPGQWCPDL